MDTRPFDVVKDPTETRSRRWSVQGPAAPITERFGTKVQAQRLANELRAIAPHVHDYSDEVELKKLPGRIPALSAEDPDEFDDGFGSLTVGDVYFLTSMLTERLQQLQSGLGVCEPHCTPDKHKVQTARLLRRADRVASIKAALESFLERQPRARRADTCPDPACGAALTPWKDDERACTQCDYSEYLQGASKAKPEGR